METHSGVLTCSIKHTLSATQHFHLSAVFRLIAYCRGLAPIIPMLIDKKMIDSLFFSSFLDTQQGLFSEWVVRPIDSADMLQSPFMFLFLGLWKGGAERKKEKEGGLLVVILFSANALVAYFIFAFPWDGCKHFFSVYCYSLNLAEGGG